MKLNKASKAKAVGPFRDWLSWPRTDEPTEHPSHRPWVDPACSQ